jgi:hypothetical protein
MPPEEGRMNSLTKFCMWLGIVLLIAASGIPNYILVSLGLANRMPWTSGHRDVVAVGLCFIVGALAYWSGHSQGMRDGRWSQDRLKQQGHAVAPGPTQLIPPIGTPSDAKRTKYLVALDRVSSHTHGVPEGSPLMALPVDHDNIEVYVLVGTISRSRNPKAFGQIDPKLFDQRTKHLRAELTRNDGHYVEVEVETKSAA